ncbi:hypothetical protein [Chryseosolibacter histidini]|nr:hypothetical protein [Chryseosolibacter histidini]
MARRIKCKLYAIKDLTVTVARKNITFRQVNVQYARNHYQQ